MHVRVCPKCGKHNLQDAWSCVDCNETLSIKTVMDTETGQWLSLAPIAGHVALSEISTHFEPDVVATLRSAVRIDESIIWGCNFAQLAKSPPFIFGYLMITSRQMICAQFASDIRRDRATSATAFLLNPLHFFIRELFGAYAESAHPLSAELLTLPYPSRPLTSTEKNSRKIIAYNLEQLLSVRTAPNWLGNDLLTSLVFSFDQNDEWTIILYSPHQAKKIHQVLNTLIDSSRVE